MHINRLFFVETGTFDDQQIRPYNTEVDQNRLRVLQEATQGGKNLAASALAGVAGSIIRPASQSQGVAAISNGWDTTRLRFFLEVVHDEPFGGQRVQYLTGFTNHSDVSLMSNQLDPRMELYFNNSIQTTRQTYEGVTGLQTSQRVIDNCHVLLGSYNAGYGHLDHSARTMRPSDVFDALSSGTMLGFDADVVDTRPTFAQSALKKSTRANSSAPHYLSRLLRAHQAQMFSADPSDNMAEQMNNAAGSVKEPTPAGDMFFKTLALQTNLNRGGSVTYGELCAIQPGLDNMVEVFLARGVHQQSNPQRGQFEHWKGSTHETIIATIMTHAVPALMMDHMVTKLGFKASNRTTTGQPTVVFTDLQTFTEGVDMTAYINAFHVRLMSEVMDDLSANNIIDYDIEAHFDVVGHTHLKIALGGSYPIEYSSPSFADSLFVPVMTNQASTLTTLAMDISSLHDNLEVDYSASVRSPAPAYHFTETFNATSGSL